MMVQAPQEQGEGSAMHTDPHHTPTIIQPSTSQPLLKQRLRIPKRKDTKGRKIDDIDKDVEIILVHEIQGRIGKRLLKVGAKASVSDDRAEGSSKRVGEDLQQVSTKKQKVDDDKESEELKKCLEIVPDDGDDVTIEATPLSSKSSSIVDYKNIQKFGKETVFPKLLE
ncbi:hypothetical protein Tco_0854830 [Tanacetum coccineum]